MVAMLTQTTTATGGTGARLMLSDGALPML
jgi:hypothetical protein